jgi:hypothetical protein
MLWSGWTHYSRTLQGYIHSVVGLLGGSHPAQDRPIHLLPPAERAKRYRELAAELDAAVVTMAGSRYLQSMSAVYEKLARDWRKLAEDAERNQTGED